MIELKAGVMRTPHDEGMSFDRDSDHIAVTEGETEFYIKSEVDKLIKDLKHQRDGAFSGLTLDDLSQMSKKEIDRQKYKRCLSMAEMCMFKSRISYFEKKSNKSRRMSKWRQRWLELAKKFKKVK